MKNEDKVYYEPKAGKTLVETLEKMFELNFACVWVEFEIPHIKLDEKIEDLFRFRIALTAFQENMTDAQWQKRKHADMQSVIEFRQNASPINLTLPITPEKIQDEDIRAKLNLMEGLVTVMDAPAPGL